MHTRTHTDVADVQTKRCDMWGIYRAPAAVAVAAEEEVEEEQEDEEEEVAGSWHPSSYTVTQSRPSDFSFQSLNWKLRLKWNQIFCYATICASDMERRTVGPKRECEREREGGVMTPTTLSDMLYGPTNSCNCSRSFSCLSSLFHNLALGLSTCFLFALCAWVKAMCEERGRERERDKEGGGGSKERVGKTESTAKDNTNSIITLARKCS